MERRRAVTGCDAAVAAGLPRAAPRGTAAQWCVSAPATRPPPAGGRASRTAGPRRRAGLAGDRPGRSVGRPLDLTGPRPAGRPWRLIEKMAGGVGVAAGWHAALRRARRRPPRLGAAGRQHSTRPAVEAGRAGSRDSLFAGD